MLNLFFHALTACLLFAFIEQLLEMTERAENPASQEKRRWLALLCSLLFAVNPIAVYAVAYLVERSTLMATMFALATLLALLHGLRTQRTAWLLLSVAFYFLALQSKEHAVMLPIVGVLLMILLREKSRTLIRPLALTVICYAAVAMLFVLELRSVIGQVYEPNLVGTISLRYARGESISGLTDHVLARSVITQGTLFFKYLRDWIIPYAGWLSIDIHEPIAPQLAAPAYLAGTVSFVGYGLALVYGWDRSPRSFGPTAFALFIPWVFFFTEFSTVRAVETFVLYRSYLWMFGLPIALALSLRHVPLKRASVGCAIWAVLLVPLTIDRIHSFSSGSRVWSDALRHNPENASWVGRLYGNRGLARFIEGDYEGALNDLGRGLEIGDDYRTTLLFARATVYGAAGDLPHALADIDASLDAGLNRFQALSFRCRIYVALKRFEAAHVDCDEAVHLRPNDPAGLLNSAVVYIKQARFSEATAILKGLLNKDTNNAQGRFSLGYVYWLKGDIEMAREEFRSSCSLGYPPACPRVK